MTPINVEQTNVNDDVVTIVNVLKKDLDKVKKNTETTILMCFIRPATQCPARPVAAVELGGDGQLARRRVDRERDARGARGLRERPLQRLPRVLVRRHDGPPRFRLPAADFLRSALPLRGRGGLAAGSGGDWSPGSGESKETIEKMK